MNEQVRREAWYSGITSYQWLVLVLASLGWVFDVFEGQIFVATMNESMPSLLPEGSSRALIDYYNKIASGAFLTGGALGGVLFGMLSDRMGRKRVMAYTILVYSVFSCLSAFAATWWQLALCRFLVALGAGGEWAVASAFVAEVFPRRARAWSQSIFHASSVLGTWLAVGVGFFLASNPQLTLTPGGEVTLTGWRLGFLLGGLPALLVLWVRMGLRESDAWLRARAEGPRAADNAGSVLALFAAPLLGRTLLAVGLATVGLATFWGTHIYGKNVLQQAYEIQFVGDDKPAPAAIKQAEMLGMFLVSTGGGLGLLCFGPISERLGRRGAFLVYQVGGLAAALVLFWAIPGFTAICLFLPVFGFLTLGMHAGYAVYFPELYPTRLRSTGAGFCFNVGRLTATPILLLSGSIQKAFDLGPEAAAVALSFLFVPGAVLLLWAPETRGTELPE